MNNSRKIAAVAVFFSTVTVVGCAPPPVDETYCTDIEEVQKAVQQYADVDRVSVTNEVMQDLNEMGANNRCPGYVHEQGMEKDD